MSYRDPEQPDAAGDLLLSSDPGGEGQRLTGSQKKNYTYFVEYGDNSITRLFIAKALSFNLDSYSEDQNYAFNPGRALYLKDVKEAMSNITTSMTNQIRRGRNSTLVLGVVLQSETVMVVQWYWCILPITMVGFGFLFLATVICVNASHGVPLWKSGLIPLFFHGIEGDLQEDPGTYRKVERSDQMVKSAASMKVGLWRNNHGHIRFFLYSDCDHQP
ncbi:hypothetical protein MPH_04346 [Macrophomina phaseolina MS6]|uniref:Uncharacterized protein n=1 Tax=Macrophomina phaseolina (strain MS6) TaxID=1126212 RepID=K2S838_MACPH|nr:hypothetical protein MPH_04346 [Macrophomina phaseolina MS6]